MALKKIKISPHHHSGKLSPHEHTSYGLLALTLLLAAFPLIAYTASAATPYTGPESGTIGLEGSVPAKPPTTAATISGPPNGQHFSTSPVTITGTCPSGTLVEIFKNNIFAGSTSCSTSSGSTSGNYTTDIDLMFGENTLIARVYDALNQAGPDSNKVTAYYDLLPAQGSALTALEFGGPQLLLNTQAVFRGSFPGQEISVPIDLIGGTPPYAINIQWGDATNSVVSRSDNVTFNAPHTYQKAGIYQVSVQATDGNGRVAFLTVAVIVNGQPATSSGVLGASGTGSSSTDTVGKLLVLWPLYTSTVAILISFWLGERREKSLLARRGQLLAH